MDRKQKDWALNQMRVVIDYAAICQDRCDVLKGDDDQLSQDNEKCLSKCVIL